jgi:hypothetical protein
MAGAAQATQAAEIHVGAEALEKILEMANEIWGKVRGSGVSPDDDAGNDKLLRRLQGEHKDFALSYPLPFRWMVQARQYNENVFKGYLARSVKAMYKDKKEMLGAQADYLAALFKARSPRTPPKVLRTYKEKVLKDLVEEDTRFSSAVEEARAEVARVEAEAAAARRQRLCGYLVAAQGLLPAGGDRADGR